MLAWALPLLITILCYGLGQAWTKQFIAAVPPSGFLALFLGAKLLANGGAWLWLGSPSLIPGGGERFAMLSLAGSLLAGIAWWSYFRAMARGKVALVGSITAAYPAVTAVAAFLALGERLPALPALGVLLVISSGVLMAYCEGGEEAPAGEAPAPSSGAWLPLAVCSFLSWGLFGAFAKAASGNPGYSDGAAFAWNLVGLFMVLSPVVAIGSRREGLGKPRDWIAASLPAALWALGDLALFFALARGPAALVTGLSGAYPLVTLAYAVPILGERLRKPQWGAVALAMLGVGLVSWPS